VYVHENIFLKISPNPSLPKRGNISPFEKGGLPASGGAEGDQG